MFVALGFAIFGLAAKYLPIFPQEHQPEVKAHIPSMRESIREPQFEASELAVPANAGD
jgi:hypothetical protein